MKTWRKSINLLRKPKEKNNRTGGANNTNNSKLENCNRGNKENTNSHNSGIGKSG